MEYSSPLAAMRPQPYPTWGSRRDVPIHRAIYNTNQPYDFSSFDFRNMSMTQQQPLKPAQKDYFNLKPARTHSSPTSSLTADLDANFHIDQSPHLTTPRRCLFNTTVIPSMNDIYHLNTPPMDLEGTTPPVPSSSPGIDCMDISPLPHKQPYFVAQVTLPSPSPVETPDELSMSEDHLSPPEEFPTAAAQPAQASTFLHPPERRRPVSRPSLLRTKPFASTNSVPQRPSSAETPLPPFRFGNVAHASFASSSTPSLIESSIGENDTFGSMLPPPRRTSAGPTGRNSGSPCAGHVRKASNGRPNMSRPPRKQIRRSLSMFQHPDDVMKEEQEIFELAPAAKLTSTMEVEQEHTLKLPHFVPDDDADGLPRISQETMTDILDTKYTSEYKQIIVIDCRFEYEYNGGHIESAVNFNDKQLLADKLFENGTDPSNTLLILHCEYSVHRAPLTAKFIRSHDRNINMEHYPRLTFPEMYILDGGYSRFYSEQPSKCYPQNYVEMNDERHEQACERGMARVKSRPKLFRAQTFAFGQSGSDDMEDSPTAQGKGASVRGGLAARSQTYQVSPQVADNIGSSFARRMASY